MTQPGPSDYRTPQPNVSHHHHMQSEGMTATAREMGDRAADLANDVGTAVKEHPYTTMAIAAGLAFAVGALWKLGHRRPRSRLDTLLEQLPDLPPKQNLWPSRWR